MSSSLARSSSSALVHCSYGVPEPGCRRSTASMADVDAARWPRVGRRPWTTCVALRPSAWPATRAWRRCGRVRGDVLGGGPGLAGDGLARRAWPCRGTLLVELGDGGRRRPRCGRSRRRRSCAAGATMRAGTAGRLASSSSRRVGDLGGRERDGHGVLSPVRGCLLQQALPADASDRTDHDVRHVGRARIVRGDGLVAHRTAPDAGRGPAARRCATSWR